MKKFLSLVLTAFLLFSVLSSGKTSTTVSAKTPTEGATYASLSKSSTKWNSSNVDTILKSIPESVKSKDIHVLMWRDYTDSEQNQIDDFVRKTGISIRTTITTESEYTEKLLSLAHKDDAPDVVTLSSAEFPSRAIKAMQVLDPYVFRLDDSCWHKPYMDNFRIKDRYYSVAIPGSWNVDDCNYITVYNKEILRQAGITTTPYKLYEIGQWNWDAQNSMFQRIIDTGRISMTIQSPDLFMLSAGIDFAKYDPDNAKFINLLNTPTIHSKATKAWKQVRNSMYNAYITTEFDISGFRQGHYAFMDIIAYTLYKESGHLNGVYGGISNIEAVPIAGPTQSEAYIPMRAKSWGVGKGADNAEGAAYFLRYFLDPSTVNMNSTFWHSQFMKVFNIVTDKNAKKVTLAGVGLSDFNNNVDTYNSSCYNILYNSDTSEVLKEFSGKIDGFIVNANSKLTEIANTKCHTYGNWITVSLPTCTEKGEDKRSCSTCNQVEIRETAAKGHSFGDWETTKEARCGVAGVQTRICSKCLYDETKDIPALEHNFAKPTTTKEATCTEEGEVVGVCTICKTETSAKVEAKGHKYGKTVVEKKATKTETGLKITTCKVCGDKKEEVIPVLSSESKKDNSSKVSNASNSSGNVNNMQDVDNPDVNDTDKNEGPNIFVIVLIIIGVAWVVCAIVAFIVILIKKRKSE